MHAPGLSPQERETLRSFARRIDPSDPGAHNNLGVLYYQKGLIDEAIESFARAVELDPKMLVAQRNLEIAYKQTGYYDRRWPSSRSGCGPIPRIATPAGNSAGRTRRSGSMTPPCRNSRS